MGSNEIMIIRLVAELLKMLIEAQDINETITDEKLREAQKKVKEAADSWFNDS